MWPTVQVGLPFYSKYNQLLLDMSLINLSFHIYSYDICGNTPKPCMDVYLKDRCYAGSNYGYLRERNAIRIVSRGSVRVGWRWRCRGVSLYLTSWLDCCFYRSDRVLCETHCLAGTLPGVLCLNELLSSSNTLVPRKAATQANANSRCRCVARQTD